MKRRDVLKYMGSLPLAALPFSKIISSASNSVDSTKPETFFDLTGTTNRAARYREYEIMRAKPEISNILEYFAKAICRPDYDNHDSQIKLTYCVNGVNGIPDQRKAQVVEDARAFCASIIKPKLQEWCLEAVVSGDVFLRPLVDSHGVFSVSRFIGIHDTYRIETIKGELIEFQHSSSGPDYQSLVNDPLIDRATMSCDASYIGADEPFNTPYVSMNNTRTSRYFPSQVVHLRLDKWRDNKGFAPYGVSLIEAFKDGSLPKAMSRDTLNILSSLDIKVCRTIERMQKSVEEAIMQLTKLHLTIKEHKPQDIAQLTDIKLNPPAEWIEWGQKTLGNKKRSNTPKV